MRRGGWRISDRAEWNLAVLILTSLLVLILCSPAFPAANRSTPTDSPAKDYSINLTTREKAWIKNHPNIRLGIDPEFAPFEFLDKNGHYQGIAADYVKLLRKRLGLRLRVVPGLTWPEVMSAAQSGGIDVLACVGKSAERQRFLVYSHPYLNFNRVIITRSRTPFISSIDDIYSWRVAVQAKSSHAAYLREHTSIIAIPYASLKQALIDLSSGQTQALVGNVASAAYWINHLHLTNLKVAAPVNQDKLYFAVRRDWPILADIINKGLASVSKQRVAMIGQRWVRIDIQRGMPWQTAFVVMAVFLGLVITGIFFNRTLRRQVISKTTELRRELAERKRSQAEAQRANRELRNLNNLLISCAASLDMRELFNQVMDGVSRISGLEGCTICFVTPEQTLELAAHRQTSPAAILDLNRNVIKVGDCLCGNCAQDKKPLILWNRQEVLEYSSRDATRHDDINFHAAFPLLVGKNCIGVLCIFTRSTAKPDKGLIQTMEAVAAQVALAMHSSRLYEETVKNAALLEEKVMERTRELEESQVQLQETVKDLNGANEKLRELDQLKSLFIASTSHELRTPLNSIIGFSAILRDEWLGSLNDEQKLNLSAIHRNGRHLLALINDIIDISKIEAGKLEGYVE
ncbi:MAG TPA: transporter substrate-binding domain-containing protein, partial [Desulfobacterales bacterium]|nr:transporter substrate-binding domain-containing protein [Desulfobacterales bacterium]